MGEIDVDPESAMRKIACVVSAGTSSSISMGTRTGAMIDHMAEPLVMITLTADSSANTSRKISVTGMLLWSSNCEAPTAITSPRCVQSKYCRNWAIAKNMTRVGANCRTPSAIIGGMFFGLMLGFVLALMRMSPLLPVRWLARFYISVFRGTPLIAQLFVIYYGLPQFGIELDPIPAAMIGLSLNTAAYTSETLRAAISSIDKGQWEAAASIGMTPWQTLRRAILPQAARVALPPLSNSFISLVKDTSLAATIQVPELFRQAQLITSRTLEVFTMYLAASLIYWVMATVLSALQNYFENQLNRQERDPK